MKRSAKRILHLAATGLVGAAYLIPVTGVQAAPVNQNGANNEIPQNPPIILSPAAPVTLNADTFTIQGSTLPNALVRAWVDANHNGLHDPGEALAASQILERGAKEFQLVVPLTPDAANHFVITASKPSHMPERESPPAVVPVIVEDSSPPETTILSAPSGTTPELAATLSFAASEPGATFECQIDGSAFEACQSPKTYENLAVGPHTFAVHARDAVGNVDPSPATATWTIQVGPPPPPPAGPAPDPAPGPVGPLPPDPATVAPPLAPGGHTDFAGSTEFLYSGPNPIQTDVQPGAIQPDRIAVLRGNVIGRDGQPLAGARVQVKDHPELGRTFSRADGRYDLAVNGGPLVIEFQRSGYLPAQRQVEARSQDYTVLPEVALVPLDPQGTVIDLASGAPIQVARGSAVQDADGARQATLLFPQGTTAELVRPDGSKLPVSTLTIRATEYTVGENGRAAMPGELPPTSAYTYALELSADEAILAGATEVRFNQPVPLYVENFLQFPVGTAVPAGYYDRQRAVWVPSDNGRVVRVLAVTGGLADLDVNGDGLADTGAALAELGVTDAERQQLALLYQPGQSLWRTPIPHFTPWDCNWPYAPPPDIELPNLPEPSTNPDGDGEGDQRNESTDEKAGEDDCQAGSVIQCREQVLREMIPIAGTDLGLIYSSDRVPGRTTNVLRIPVTNAQIPASLETVRVHVAAAGYHSTVTYPPTGNLVHTFSWDGTDGFGRQLSGAVPIQVTIEHGYRMQYFSVPSEFERAFGAYAAATGGDPNQLRRSGMTIPLTQSWNGTIRQSESGQVAEFQTVGGWTLSAHHSYDPVRGTISYGDGSQRAVDPETVQTAGNLGSGQPTAVVLRADGAALVADAAVHRVWQVAPDRTRTVLAGTGTPAYGGDGGLAGDAHLNAPAGLALGSDGSVYIADTGNHRIRRVTPDGLIYTVAGHGTSGLAGDGGSALAAQLNGPQAVAVGPDGTLYIADTGNNLVRRVDTGGVITTIAGGGFDLPVDGLPAQQAFLNIPAGLALQSDGSLLILATGYGVEGSEGRVLRLPPDGFLWVVAGTDQGYAWQDGIPATEVVLPYPRAIALGPDGSLYIGHDSRVRRVDQRGIISTVAGHWGLSALAVAADGALYLIGDGDNTDLTRLGESNPRLESGEYAIPTRDGRAVDIFGGSGQHLHTIDALTGALRWQFGYDAAYRLTEVKDGDGNVTRIEYTDGRPSAIVGPYGHRTTLGVDANGWLETVTNPALEETRLTSTPGGLLTSLTDARGAAHHFGYDPDGRLLTDQNPDGKVQTLARTVRPDGRGYTVTITTTEGRTTTFTEERRLNGSVRRTMTGPDGTTTVTDIQDDGTVEQQFPDGSSATITREPDPRWGLLAPISDVSYQRPGGQTLNRDITRQVTLANPDNVFSLAHLVEQETVNGRVTTIHYDAGTRTISTTTPENRQATVTLDDRGRIVAARPATSFLPTTFSYDLRGRLQSIVQGTGTEQRTTVLTYGPDGFLANVTDPLSRVTSFGRDALGRVTTQTRPDGKVVGPQYDKQGNLEQVTPPGRPTHLLGTTLAGRQRFYEAPAPNPMGTAARTEWGRDLDGLVTSLTRADGVVVATSRDGAGRVETVGLPQGQVVAAYDSTTGLIQTLTAPGGVALAFGYDGSLLTNETWSGPVAGTVSTVLDEELRLSSRSINGASATYLYDDDGAITRAGALAVTPDPATGLPTAASLGGVGSAWGYDGFGELRSLRATYNSSTLYHAGYTRDKLGRVTKKLESVGPFISNYEYAYDPAGRLREVKKDGVVVEAYTYDDNGNRLTATTAAGTLNAGYDDRDRLIQQGETTYDYTAEGELRTKTAGAQTTTYTYDPRGALLAVALPDGRTVEYLVDGKGRRVGKRVDGNLVQGFLYADSLRVAAELDGAGNVVSRFIYASGYAPVYLEKAGRTYRLVTDDLGSVRLVVDSASGQVVQRIDYDAWGNILQDTNPGFQPFGFAGGLYDRDTGLLRFGARDYDPQTGRWTARDPILFNGGQTNLYAYVGNDPVNFVDRNGLETESAEVEPRNLYEKVVWKTLDWRESISDKVSEWWEKLTKKATEKYMQVEKAVNAMCQGAGPDPEGAADILDLGLDHLPSPSGKVKLVPTDLAQELLDQGLEHSRDVQNHGTIHHRSQEWYRELGIYP